MYAIYNSEQLEPIATFDPDDVAFIVADSASIEVKEKDGRSVICSTTTHRLIYLPSCKF